MPLIRSLVVASLGLSFLVGCGGPEDLGITLNSSGDVVRFDWEGAVHEVSVRHCDEGSIHERDGRPTCTGPDIWKRSTAPGAAVGVVARLPADLTSPMAYGDMPELSTETAPALENGQNYVVASSVTRSARTTRRTRAARTSRTKARTPSRSRRSERGRVKRRKPASSR